MTGPAFLLLQWTEDGEEIDVQEFNGPAWDTFYRTADRITQAGAQAAIDYDTRRVNLNADPAEVHAALKGAIICLSLRELQIAMALPSRRANS